MSFYNYKQETLLASLSYREKNALFGSKIYPIEMGYKRNKKIIIEDLIIVNANPICSQEVA
jgi:hypothetical protein